jgi:hypothetical protein
MAAVVSDLAEVGRRVARARREQGMTQAELGKALGLDRTAVSKIESGQRALNALEFARLAGLVGRKMEWFVAMPPNIADLRRKRRQILRICSKHGARRVRVFGSVARGETEPDSDVDFLVDLEPGRSLMDHAALIGELADLLGHKVDVATEGGLRDRARERILSEAVPL